MNPKAFNELINRYETMTVKEVEEAFKGNTPAGAKTSLTGFGSNLSCSLCRAAVEETDETMIGLPIPDRITPMCMECIWTYTLPEFVTCACTWGANAETYDKMQKAVKPIDFINACDDRAQYMRACKKKLRLKIFFKNIEK